MARLYLVVGLPGAGKTTLARQLERDLPALRLTPDEVHLALWGDDLAHPDHDTRHTDIEVALWPIALSALAAGADVVLDFGFWSRAERDDFRARARLAGHDCRVVAPPDPGPAARSARIAARLGGFSIQQADLDLWAALYEPPTSDELDA